MKGFWIVQRRHHRLVAHFFHHDHGGVLVQRLVDGDHLAHLHQGLDHFRRLDRHLVCQLCHRDGFRHMHFDDARFCRWLRSGDVALVAGCHHGGHGPPRQLLRPATPPPLSPRVLISSSWPCRWPSWTTAWLTLTSLPPAPGRLVRQPAAAVGTTGTNGGLVQGALLGVAHGGRLGRWLSSGFWPP